MPSIHYTRSTKNYLPMQIIVVPVTNKGVVLVGDHHAEVRVDLSLLLRCPSTQNHSTSTR